MIEFEQLYVGLVLRDSTDEESHEWTVMNCDDIHNVQLEIVTGDDDLAGSALVCFDKGCDLYYGDKYLQLNNLIHGSRHKLTHRSLPEDTSKN